MTNGKREFTMGGGWGDAINWENPERFSKPFDEKTKFEVVGWKSPKPEHGDTLKAEFEKSWIWFRFVKVKPCGDPPDMFFATVVAVKQEMK